MSKPNMGRKNKNGTYSDEEADSPQMMNVSD